MRGLLIAVVSRVAEHGLWGSWASAVGAHGLSSCSSQALECRLNNCGHGLSCSMVCGILSGQGSNPCFLHWQADSLALSTREAPIYLLMNKITIRKERDLLKSVIEDTLTSKHDSICMFILEIYSKACIPQIHVLDYREKKISLRT